MSLAIDTNTNNKTEAERWSKLFIAIYNSSNMAFCLEDLKKTFSQLPQNYQLILAKKFKLFEVDESLEQINRIEFYSALKMLKLMDEGKDAFSVNAKIAYLQKLQQNAIQNSNFHEEWDIEITDLNLSVRAINALSRAGIKTLNDLFSRTLDSISHIRNVGEKMIKDEILPLYKKYNAEPLN